jgi:hypothetical protein
LLAAGAFGFAGAEAAAFAAAAGGGDGGDWGGHRCLLVLVWEVGRVLELWLVVVVRER